MLGQERAGRRHGALDRPTRRVGRRKRIAAAFALRQLERAPLGVGGLGRVVRGRIGAGRIDASRVGACRVARRHDLRRPSRRRSSPRRSRRPERSRRAPGCPRRTGRVRCHHDRPHDPGVGAAWCPPDRRQATRRRGCPRGGRRCRHPGIRQGSRPARGHRRRGTRRADGGQLSWEGNLPPWTSRPRAECHPERSEGSGR